MQWLPLRVRPNPGEADADVPDDGAVTADVEDRLVEFDDVRECLLTLGMSPHQLTVSVVSACFLAEPELSCYSHSGAPTRLMHSCRISAAGVECTSTTGFIPR